MFVCLVLPEYVQDLLEVICNITLSIGDNNPVHFGLKIPHTLVSDHSKLMDASLVLYIQKSCIRFIKYLVTNGKQEFCSAFSSRFPPKLFLPLSSFQLYHTVNIST